jgi:hypothetical protein
MLSAATTSGCARQYVIRKVERMERPNVDYLSYKLSRLKRQLLCYVWVCEEPAVFLRIAKQGRAVSGPATGEGRSRRGVLGRAIR